MTPSELGWTQGVVFLFLGTVTSGVVSLCVRNCRTKQGEREVELEGILIGTDTGTVPFEGEPPSELGAPLRGGDDEGGSTSNDAPEAIVFAALPCSWSNERKRRLSNGRTLKPPSTKKSRGRDVVPQTEPRRLRRRARGSDGVADPATPRVSSTVAGLPRPPRRRFVPKPKPHDEGIPQVDPIQPETFPGLRRRYSERNGKFAVEFRLKSSATAKKWWLGTFKTREQAELATDIARYYHGSRSNFPFSGIPEMLANRPVPAGLDGEEKRMFVKREAQQLSLAHFDYDK